jgi:hypothetical protein
MSTIEQRLNEIEHSAHFHTANEIEVLKIARKLLPAFHEKTEKPDFGRTTLKIVQHEDMCFGVPILSSSHDSDIGPDVQGWMYESELVRLFTTWAGEGGE